MGELAKDIGVSASALRKTFDDYNEVCRTKNDPFGKKFFKNGPFTLDDHFHVAIVTPVIHYCMGGVNVSAGSEVLTEGGEAVPGLWAAGEVMGGTHGIDRLGGSSLLDCVVFGRVSGRNAANYMMQKAMKFQKEAAEGRLANVLGHISGGIQATVNVQ